MLTGLLASLIESVGDYHACARLSGAPPPPKHAMNRGITAEGIGVFVAGAFGCGIDTTAYGENIGALGITKVKTGPLSAWKFSSYCTVKLISTISLFASNLISIHIYSGWKSSRDPSWRFLVYDLRHAW